MAPAAAVGSAPAEGGEGLHDRAGFTLRAHKEHFAPHRDAVSRHGDRFAAMGTDRLGPLVVPDAFAHEQGLSTRPSIGLSVLLPLEMMGGSTQEASGGV